MKISVSTRLVIVAVLLVLIVCLQYGLSHSAAFLSGYQRYIFLPLQQARSYVLDRTDFSIGDWLYLILAILLLTIIGRMVYFGITFQKNKAAFWVELLRFVTFPLVLYISFLILWGGNYDRPTLSSAWDVKTMPWKKEQLVALNQQLLSKLNDATSHDLSFPKDEQLNREINSYYQQRFGSCVPQLKVKSTSLGYLLNYLGIQGYYNPFSGEGQFNSTIPAFMHPFVVAHEMAHQTGIAAEDDANLIAYILCSESDNKAISYSANFNLFLYAYSELKMIDRPLATTIFEQLNQQSKKHYEELRALNNRYRSRFRKVSNSLYDEYLRLHGQTEGLESYSFVTRWAYYWDTHKEKGTALNVCP